MASSVPDRTNCSALIKSVTIENFKSFSAKTTVAPLTNFCAIVGPNGSGKSNFFDAICFALGEKPQNLRVSKLKDLISSSSTDDSSHIKSYVELSICDLENKNSEIILKRKIINSSKSQWYINGDVVSAKNYEELLENIGLSLKSKNFIIYQGTVESIATKSPLELTDLFENISGSQQFKDKYDQLKSEVDEHDRQFKKILIERKKIFGEHKFASSAKLDLERYHKMKANIENIGKTIEYIKLYELDNFIKSKSDEISSKKDEIQHLTDEVLKLKGEIKKQDSSDVVNSESLKQMDKEINNLNSKMKEFKLKYVSVNNLISSSKNESEKYSEIAEKLKLQLESDKCSINELEKKLLTLEHRSKDPEKVYISSLSQSFPKISADALKVFSDLNFEFKKESKILLEKRTINHKDITKKENNVNSLNQTKSQLLIEYDQITADYKSYQNIFDAQTNSLRSGRFELENINTAVNQLNLKISEAKNKIRASNNELKSINEQLSNAHGFNIENSSKKSRSIVIQSLKQAFSTIHGRVYEFCEPRNSKYNLAVTRILGQHLNSIIVDTFDSTRDAISFLKTERINQECFLPIDTIKPYVINPSVKRFSELNKVPFLIDVLKYDQKFHNIYSHLCKDTLICKNSEEARNFAYERVSESGEKLFFKTVSYDGIVFKKSGFITGGMSDLKTKAKVWDEAQINNLMEKQASLNLDIRKNLVILRQEKELSDYLAKSKYLESRNENLENSLKSISSSIENTKENLSIVGDKIKTIDCQINDSKTDIRSLFEYDDRIKNDLFTAFSEIFQNFCSHQDINCESLYEIVYEKSKRTFDIVEKQIEQEKSELSSQIRLLKSKNTQQKIDSIGVTKKNIELSIDKNIEIIQNLEKSISEYSEKIELKNHAKKNIQESIEHYNSNFSMLNSNIVSKQHNLSNLKKKLITAETLQNSKLSVKEDLILRLNRGNLPIKFAPGSTRDIDYTLIEKYIANAKNGKSLPSVLKELNSKQEKLTLDFKNMSLPNSVYIKKYDDLSLQMKKINSECDSIRKTIQKIDDELQDVKSQRIETFNKFYEEVSMNLGTVYRELSGSKSGQAYLSLINTQEPYLEGVLFSCIVPGKHYTYMENLSGGEKSLAALSLIFAIAHAAKNGRKYPLFILDEVCAALDADNVRKLSKFITHHSHEYNTQFILISHKLEMYHNANVLFGLYKQDQSTELLSLDLESYKKEV